MQSRWVFAMLDPPYASSVWVSFSKSQPTERLDNSIPATALLLLQQHVHALLVGQHDIRPLVIVHVMNFELGSHAGSASGNDLMERDSGSLSFGTDDFNPVHH